MTIDQLINSATLLNRVDQSSSDEYKIKTDILTALVNNEMLYRQDLSVLIGENNEQMMKDNHANHARFIHSILVKPNAEVLVQSVLWVFRTYLNHGFTKSYWSEQLNVWLSVLEDQLSPDSLKQISPLYYWILSNIDNFASLAIKQSEFKLETLKF